MKQSKILVVIILLIFSLSCSKTKSGWTLVWSDEFSQRRGIDTTVWSKIPRGNFNWNRYMSDYDSLYAVEKGKLILRGIVNTTQTEDTASFLTGGLYTMGKRQFENGRIEIRARLESAKGAWPAFWLLPDKENRIWPDDGEINIMEHLNHDSIVYQTVHSHYTHTLKIKNNPVSSGIGVIDRDGYNVYAVELSKDSVVFFVNDNRTLSYPRVGTRFLGQYPYDKPFFLLIDMQLGGNWVGSVDPKELPVQMYIDWVRFYKKNNK